MTYQRSYYFTNNIFHELESNSDFLKTIFANWKYRKSGNFRCLNIFVGRLNHENKTRNFFTTKIFIHVYAEFRVVCWKFVL